MTLVRDAHTTEDLSEWGAPTPDLVIRHTNIYWGWQSAPAASPRCGDADAYGTALAVVDELQRHLDVRFLE